MAQRYRGFGLTITSPFPVPGALPTATSAAMVDLTITAGPARLGPAAQDSPPYRQLGTQLELAVPDIASYLLENPGRLTVEPQPGAKPADVSALLIATAIPMALWARGGLVLHASGIVPSGGNRTLALAGPSGSGKSALARGLIASGGKLVGDDSLWLCEGGGGINASGLPGGLFEPDAGQPERKFHPVTSNAQLDTAPLGAIIVLDPAAPSGPPLRLTGTAALTALLRHRHRPSIPALLGVEAERLALAALLCGQVPVYALGGAPEAVADRLNHLRALSLAGV